MAQIGSFVPATRARIGIIDRLFSRVGAADDLARGRSTFMVEMVETAVILNQATRTRAGDPRRNRPRHRDIRRPVDRMGGDRAPARGHRCRALFATHYHELTALSAKLPRLFNATVRVKEWHGEVVFLHEVLPGAADRSYGIQVAKLAGLPPSVIARAKSVLAKLEAQDRGSTVRRLVDDLPLFAVPCVRRRRIRAAERNRAIDRSVEIPASGRDVPARGAGSALCAQGETAETVIAVLRMSRNLPSNIDVAIIGAGAAGLGRGRCVERLRPLRRRAGSPRQGRRTRPHHCPRPRHRLRSRLRLAAFGRQELIRSGRRQARLRNRQDTIPMAQAKPRCRISDGRARGIHCRAGCVRRTPPTSREERCRRAPPVAISNKTTAGIR